MTQGNLIFEMEIDWGEVRSIAAMPFGTRRQRREIHAHANALDLFKPGPMGERQRRAINYIRTELDRRGCPFLVLAHKNKPLTTGWDSKEMAQEVLRQGLTSVSKQAQIDEGLLRRWCIFAWNGRDRDAIKAALLNMTAVGGAP